MKVNTAARTCAFVKRKISILSVIVTASSEVLETPSLVQTRMSPPALVLRSTLS